jgi:hypothetical protein
MLCGQCGRKWVVDLDWVDRWEQALESCPGCGVTCEDETAPRVTVDPDDLALTDEKVSQLAWYHTSTQVDWPTNDFDPAVKLTPQTRQMMGGDYRVARWAERQRSKALHVGTYEAAVHNMLRRIHDQADHGSQFHLYRVHLKSTVTVRAGWLVDPSNFVGDVVLDEVCPPGIDVTRYLNYHEDPGGLSLALGRAAIACTQQIAVPLRWAEDPSWSAYAVTELDNADETSLRPTGSRVIGRRTAQSSRSKRAHEITASLAQRLPINLRFPFQAAAALTDTMAAEMWTGYVIGLMDMLLAPKPVLTELDAQTVRYF